MSASQLLAGAGIDLGVDADQVVSFMMVVPLNKEYLNVLGSNQQGSKLGLGTGKSRLFVNLRRCAELKGELAIGLAAYAVSQSWPISVFAQLARQLIPNFKWLSKKQAELLCIIAQLSNGKPYEAAVSEGSILAEFGREQGSEIMVLLEQMVQSSILIRVNKSYVISR